MSVGVRFDEDRAAALAVPSRPFDACIARQRSLATATQLFEIASEQLAAVGLGAFVSAARYRLGEGMPNDSGREDREAAVRWLTERGVRNPLRMIDSHAPV